ncbi:MAG: glycosyltransferase [Ruthenibacterium sp.]
MKENERMQGVYISDEYEAILPAPKTGVGKKIQEQIQTLKDFGLFCEHICVRNKPITLWDKIRMRTFLLGDGLSWNVNNVIREADFLYIRKPTVVSRNFICFLKEIRNVAPCCKILLELPTYPYDKELSTPLHRLPLLWQDRHYRSRLARYIDRIVVLSNYDEVFGIPTLKIRNGINLSVYRLKKQNTSSTFNIGCAAQYARWHGIDRVLRGMAQYKRYSNPKHSVHLYLAGEGPELNDLQKLTNQLGLQSEVTFCGKLNRKQLYEQLYDCCDIGVECLAIFRKNMDGVSSSIKSREYLAVGIPFIYSGKIDILEQNAVDFALKIPASEEPVDIQSVINAYNKLLQKETKKELSVRIRTYANQYASWQTTMSEVVEWIQQGEKGE